MEASSNKQVAEPGEHADHSSHAREARRDPAVQGGFQADLVNHSGPELAIQPQQGQKAVELIHRICALALQRNHVKGEALGDNAINAGLVRRRDVYIETRIARRDRQRQTVRQEVTDFVADEEELPAGARQGLCSRGAFVKLG